MASDDAPSTCGFRVPATRLPIGRDEYVCDRPARAGGRCVWHSPDESPSLDALAAARSEGSEALDGLQLPDRDLQDRISFADCSLVDADFSGADLWGADFSGANLQHADFSGARLRGVDFTDAHLRSADLSGTQCGDAEFSNAMLRGATLRDADLRDVDLSDQDLRNATMAGARLSDVNLSGSVLRNADLTEAVLQGADLSGAVLQAATLTSVDCGSADLTNTSLQRADFAGADLRDATLDGCRISDTHLRDVDIDETTEFGRRSGFEREADEEAEAAVTDRPIVGQFPRLFRILGRSATDPRQLERSEIQYRTIQRLLREHDLRQDAGLAIQEKHARRKRAAASGNYGEWLKLATYRWPLGYGEQPWHVVGSSIAIIGLGTLLYPMTGLRDGVTGTVIHYGASSMSLVETFGRSFYFSTITFTTLGYGDIHPVGVSRTLATVESFVGALLMAFLVFVLGRRLTW